MSSIRIFCMKLSELATGFGGISQVTGYRSCSFLQIFLQMCPVNLRHRLRKYIHASLHQALFQRPFIKTYDRKSAAGVDVGERKCSAAVT